MSAFHPFRFLIYSLLIFTMLCLRTAPHAFGKQPWRVGLTKTQTLGKGQDAALISLMKDIFAVYTAKTKEEFNFKLFLSDKDLKKAVQAGTVDFTHGGFVTSTDLNPQKYRVFITIRMFGEPLPKRCIYVSKNNPAKSIMELKGQPATLPGSLMSYAGIRTLLGQPPENFFGKINFYKDDASSLYALALGQTQVVMVKRAFVKFYGFTNPGPVKGIREMACYEDGIWMTLAHHPRVPLNVIHSLQNHLSGLGRNQDPRIKRLQPLIKRLSLKLIPLSHEDFNRQFEKFAAIRKSAEKKGWFKDLSHLKKLARINP